MTAARASTDGRQAPTFPRILRDHGLDLRRAAYRVLQLNLGRLCNQSCNHCHVGAGPKPSLVYLSRALCSQGKALKRLRLGTELQEVLADTAHELGREARWVDRPSLFEQPEAADSGDILVCFGPVESTASGARVDASVGSRDGTREQSSFEFAHDGEHWVLAQ